MNEIKTLKEDVGENGTIHSDDLETKLGRNEFSFEWVSEFPSPHKCIYCNEDWTPEMMSFYLESGYCETCYCRDYSTVIACSKCGKIVYKK